MLLLCAFIVGSSSAWADPETVASFSRSGNTNTTTGGEFTITFSAKSGYYQDANGDCYMQIRNTSAYWTTTPTSISLAANIGGGSGNTDLTDAVYVALLDADGNEISSTKTSVTSHITTNTGDNYNISIPVANNVYGVKISHNKIHLLRDFVKRKLKILIFNRRSHKTQLRSIQQFFCTGHQLHDFQHW